MFQEVYSVVYVVVLLHREREWAPNAYVSLHPHPKVERIATGVVPSSQTPLWNHHTLTHIPNLYLDPHVRVCVV